MAAAGAVVAVIAAVIVGTRGSGEKPRASIVASVARLAAQPTSEPGVAAVAQPGQSASITMAREAGVAVVVARSQTAFSAPDQAVPMTSADGPWLARRGRITLVCFDLPHPLLVAGPLPADQLVQLALRLEQDAW